MPDSARYCRICNAWGDHHADRHDKPKWVDLFGIDPDYCDGKPVDEWLDEQRGGGDD